jgi:hypothetical protein
MHTDIPNGLRQAQAPSDCGRRQWDVVNLPALSVRHRNVIFLANHSGLFRANPVGNEAPMILSFLVICTIVTQQVLSGKLAS